MAGKTLKFVFSIVSLREATAEEISMGVVGGLEAHSGGCCGSGNCDDEEPETHNHGEGGCGCSH